MSFGKRIERYVSAFFKLGRTARLAKAASHSAQVLEPRLDALTQDFYELSARHTALEGLPDHLRGAERRLEAIDAELRDAREARDWLAERLDAAEPRLAQADRVEAMGQAAAEAAEGIAARVEARLAAAEAEARRLDDAVSERGAWEREIGETVRASEAAIRVVGEDLRRERDRLDARLGAAEVGSAELSGRLDLKASELVAKIDAMIGELDAKLAERIDRIGARLDAIDERLDASDRYFRDLETAFQGANEDTHGRLASVERDIGAELRPHAAAQDTRLGGFERRVDAVAADVAQAGRAYADLSRRLDVQRFRVGEARADTPPDGPAPREGLDALLDAFYGRLEDRFRGAREEIKGRLAVYLPDIARAVDAAPDRPVLDLGCGRGEWVELLTERGIAARGIDLNPVQIDEAKAAGLAVEQGDALAALAEAPDHAFAAITAHHLIEHLPFERLVWMTREALRVLAPGGVLIYETPNCHNLVVGARTFHIDPTHVKPLPAELLTTLLDTVGYHPVEARPLHPSETLSAFERESRADPYLAELMFGAQDLAVIATKPGIG